MSPRRTPLAVLVVLTLLGADLLSYLALIRAKDQAQRDCRDAASCQRLAAHIVQLKAKPPIAAAQDQALKEISSRIESAAEDLGIASDNHLAAITPESAIRVADTAYLEKPTTVFLRQVTLPQVVGLLVRLAGDGTGLQVKSLRLTVPTDKQSDQLWTAEFTVMYLIYSPQPQAKPQT